MPGDQSSETFLKALIKEIFNIERIAYALVNTIYNNQMKPL